MAKTNPFEKLRTSLQVGDETYEYFDLTKLEDERLAKLPYSIRVLLESVVRNCDEYVITKADVEKVLAWTENSKQGVEIPFMPARVLLQDFTGVPSVVDLAAMRSAMARLGGEPDLINPAVPADLVVDHSVQVDYFGVPDAAQKNQKREIERNHERFAFLKWGSKAFKGFQIVPPGSGIVHQVNLEYLARVVFNKDGVLYPDSLVGTDSHTTMINGLGVTGWGVGGIEAESVMLGQAITMVLPEVVGFRLIGAPASNVTATDVVLTVVERLRQLGVVGKFVEFYGPGLAELSLADRATIGNMAPEYGATMGFFPIDRRTIEYLEQTGRPEQKSKTVEAYLRAQKMYIDHEQKAEDPTYTTTIELDLATVVPSVAGPKRPHDRIAVHDLKTEFKKSLTHTVGFHGFGLKPEVTSKTVDVEINGEKSTIGHGSVVIAAITSCTNTSNPAVMLGAGLVCKKAVERGLKVPAYCKTSLAPGSHVVTSYLDRSGLTEYMDKLGFNTVGYGCTSCIGNSGDLVDEASKAIADGDLVAAAVLSGNRNFEGRVHSEVRAAFLASPPLVVAYALAGTVDIDFESTPIGVDGEGKDVFLKEIWPSNQEIQEVISKNVLKSMFQDVYKSITDGTPEWDALEVPDAKLFPWSDESTYIHHPPFFQTMGPEPDGVKDVKDAFVLLNMGDSITTDHISPAGRIAKDSPAAKYLGERGVERRDFNTYGSRRGNDEIMARGTFANVRLVNKFCDKPGPRTVHHPSGKVMAIYDAAMEYKKAGQHQILIAGAMYGSGSSRDWAAKGPHLHGISAVIATSYERIHRSNLVGMGVVPLQFLEGESLESHGLTGKERYSIDLTSKPLEVGQKLTVKADNGTEFQVLLRADTAIEIEYLNHGGILHFVLRKLLKENKQ